MGLFPLLDINAVVPNVPPVLYEKNGGCQVGGLEAQADQLGGTHYLYVIVLFNIWFTMIRHTTTLPVVSVVPESLRVPQEGALCQDYR